MPQTDPWEEAAKSYKASGAQSAPTSGASPASGNDDWKIWNQDASTPKMSANSGLMSGIQDSFDQNTKTSPNEPLLETGLKSVVGAIGQPFVHPVDTVTGMAQAARHPIDQAHQEVDALRANPAYEGTKMAGSLFGNMALGGAAGSLPGAVGDVADMIPTRAKGGKILDSVLDKARDQPVTLSPQTMAPLERTQQLAMAGGKPFGTADKLYQRVQSVNPLAYGEARDFAQNMSLSPEDKMSLKKSMRYEVPRLSKSFNQDVGRAAEAAGVGPEYQRGMSVYRNGARFEDAKDALAKYGGRAALGAVGAGGLYELKKALW